ncbi:MAG: PIG-L deacetylase family protein [Candidatus Omnitrophota bacterium]|nr:PIG-L deacetylase family protein [Candidatus Omnitrophota bacterium]
MDNFFKKQTLLVVSPHADDDVFGCAGTIAKVKDLGGKVYVMLFSIGDLRQYYTHGKIITASTREKEFIKTMKFLGVDGYDIIFKDTYKHLRLDTIPRRELIAVIERESKISLEKIKPTIVALPSISYNQDHEAVFRAGFTACRPHLETVRPFPKIVLAYDSPTHFWNVEREKFHPNFYVDISKYFSLKLKALRIHKSQAKPRLHYLSVENLADLSRLRGREISVEAAEAFMSYRFVL